MIGRSSTEYFRSSPSTPGLEWINFSGVRGSYFFVGVLRYLLKFSFVYFYDWDFLRGWFNRVKLLYTNSKSTL